MRRFAAPLFFALAVTAPTWAATKAAIPHGTSAATQAMPAAAQATPATTQKQAASTSDTDELTGVVDPKQWMDVQNLLSRVSSVVGRFKSDPKMTALMGQARGIFIVPAFGHGTSPSTGPWGAAVLMANNNGRWSDAAFFTLGGGSLGPHVIANGGSLILFIMNDRAMAKFESGAAWSLSSAPGTNIVNYSAATPQDLSGHGADFVAWSASGGPNSDTDVNVTDISVNTALNSTVYGTPNLRNILANRAPYINQDVINLRREMPSVAAVTTPASQNRPSRHA